LWWIDKQLFQSYVWAIFVILLSLITEVMFGEVQSSLKDPAVFPIWNCQNGENDSQYN